MNSKSFHTQCINQLADHPELPLMSLTCLPMAMKEQYASILFSMYDFTPNSLEGRELKEIDEPAVFMYDKGRYHT
jgi:hypothetical protein